MSMTLAEARSEARAVLEQAEAIENRYPGDITDAEDAKQVKALLETYDDLATKMLALEDAQSRKSRIRRDLDKLITPAGNGIFSGQGRAPGDEPAGSPGYQFVTSAPYRQMRSDGAFKSELNIHQMSVQLQDGTSLMSWKERMQQEAKTLLFSGSGGGGSAFVLPDYRPGVFDLLQRDITILDLIPRIQTSSDTISYIQQDTFTNSAAVVHQATATTGTSGLKPESALSYSRQTADVKTIAHWIPVTNRMLDDAPAMRGLIDTQLLLGVELVLEDQVIKGDGTGDNFTGILVNANISKTGTAALGLGVIDSLLRARTVVRVTGHGRPNAIVMHPLDLEAIRMTRENVATGTLGQYLMAPPNQAGPLTLWGMLVTEAEAITENTALVGDFSQGVTLYDRQQAAIRVGTIDDQFVRNMQTILAEGRWSLVVGRPKLFCSITGV